MPSWKAPAAFRSNSSKGRSTGGDYVRPFLAASVLAIAAWGQDPVVDSLDRDYSTELPRIAPLEPQAALASFEIHPDFRMDLVAAEPLVRDPIAMAFDERGRLFVVEMRGYSEQREENIGAVQLLEDKDGDGIYDAASDYVDGLAWPTAVACYQGGAFVAVPPDILYCKDTDGDGRADTREIVFTGFGLENVQGLLNSFTWGLDGRIHGATSSSGANVTKPGAASPPLSLRGRDFSFDPRTLEIRAESGGGQHGLTFDLYGNEFVCHNSRHIIHVVYEDRYIARNPYLKAPSPLIDIPADGAAADVFRISPVEPWRIVRTRLRVGGLVPGPIEGGGTAAGYFTSATGVTIYKGDAWPKEYRGQAFIGDVGSNLIHRKTLRPDGVTFIAERADAGTEFVRSTDIWFRPVQFANAPDGCLYVADMYREVIEHPDSLPPIIKHHLDLTSGNDRGRIYRIAPKGFQHRPVPDLSAATNTALAELVAHPNAWHHETAMRLLLERGAKDVGDPLRKIAKRDDTPDARIRALHTLENLGLLDVTDVANALDSNSPVVREHGLLAAEPLLRTGIDTELIFAVLRCTYDPDERVRYRAAFAIGEAQPPWDVAGLQPLIQLGLDDPWTRLAVLSSVGRRPAAVLTNLLLDASAFRTPLDGDFIEPLAEFVGAMAETKDLASCIAKLTLVKDDDARDRIVRGVLRGGQDAGRPRAIAEVVAANPIARGVLDKLRADAVANSTNRDKPAAARMHAIRDLGFVAESDALPILEQCLSADESGDVQSAALNTLSQMDSTIAAKILLRAWPALGPSLRERAMETLSSTASALNLMFDALDSDSFNARQIDSVRASQLRNHPDEHIRERALKLLTPTSNRDSILERYRPVLTMSGDSAKGKVLFAENCAQCHRFQGQGSVVGPDLATVAQAGPEKILTNLLDPNREVNPQYTNYVIETNDFETHTGIISSETATAITLLRAHGETDTILRSNIESITSTALSIMPEGLEDALGVQGVSDLLAYLTAK